ncbi:MAG: hypothetical protein LBT46_07245 [Planctomycetaceae bacterium]|jgi:integrase|nr:hypothetical protein [Planctomycetaceae bacterium]
MATLIIRESEHTPGYEIQWYEDKRRRTIYLGGKRFSRKTAERLKEIVEALLFYRDNSITIPEKPVLNWLESASKPILAKLQRSGLIDLPEEHTCGEMWAAFLKQKTGVKETTRTAYKDAQHRFFETFAEFETLDVLTKERLLACKESLLQKYAKATVSGTLKKTSSMFVWAVEEGWLDKNPLAGIPKGSQVNREHDRIITMEEYRLLLDACPSREWRVIIAFARIGGIRCPSELIPLRWPDIDWEHNRVCIVSPKTERFEGKEGRVIPLFPDLRIELEALFREKRDDGFIIRKYRNPSQSLAPFFRKIAVTAGFGMIARPFDNMRMSRSNEILRQFGSDLESAWIGHSSKVRKEHYFRVNDDDFDKAGEVTLPAKIPAVCQSDGIKSACLEERQS